VKSFLVKMGAVLLPLVLFTVLVDLGTFLKKDIYHTKGDLLDQHKDQVEVLFMGSSMMFTSVMPQFSDVPALNLGLPIESMYTSLRMVSHLQSQLPKLHTVVISVSANNLFATDHTLNPSERDYWLRFGLPMETGG
jgi:hypothetical protein